MSTWSLLPTLVVRTAGFPWQLVGGLAYPRTAAAAVTLVELEQQAEALKRERSGGWPSRGNAARLRGLRRLPADAPYPADWLQRWNTVTTAIQAARHHLARTEAEESSKVTSALQEVVRDPRFRDAVACSSPGFYRDLRRGGCRTSQLRRQVGSYVQRLAAKCETMSFFGPINIGHVDADRAAQTMLAWDGYQSCPRRQAYPSAWLFQALLWQACASAEIAPRLTPRRKLRTRLPAGGQKSPVRSVVAEADGRTSLGGIAARTGLPMDAAVAALNSAMEQGYLTHDLEPSASLVDPLRWLTRRIGEAAPDGSAQQTLRDAVALLDCYPDADPDAKLDLQQRLVGLTTPGDAGMPLRQSKFYHDRVPIHEAAMGTLDLRVGGALADDLRETVVPVLDLLAADADQTRRLTNQAVARRLGAGRFPLVTAMRACADLPVVASGWLQGALATAVQHAGSGATAQPPDIDLAGRLPAAAPPCLPVCCSLDVMVATADLAGYASGQTLLIISDIHDAPLLTPWAVQFHPDGKKLIDQRNAALGAALAGITAVSVVARRTTGLPSWELPGLVLEFGPATRSAPTVMLDDLYVSSDGECARLCSTAHRGDLVWHNGELDTGFHTAFALPRVRRPRLPAGKQLPRLRYANVVLARRTWRIGRDDLDACQRRSTAAEQLAAVRRRWLTRGLPDQFFAKAPHERKPIYVDATSPVLLDGLCRLGAQAPYVDLTEVLPAPGQLWLRHAGEAVAAELRCVYVRAGSES